MTPGWKGRAQQISMLKDRLKELTKAAASGKTEKSVSSEKIAPAAEDFSEKHINNLKKMESSKKDLQNKINIELEVNNYASLCNRAYLWFFRQSNLSLLT